MSTPLKSPRAGKSIATGSSKRAQRVSIVDHAEIARMAAAEAASREAERRDMIAAAAYFLAQKRGFEPGHELEDWFAAEGEVLHSQQLSLMASGADAP